MRALVIGLAVTLAAAGCGKVRTCRSGTVLLAVSGAADGADTLTLDISVGSGAPKTVTIAWKSGGGTVEIDFPAGYPRGQTITVTATATQAGIPIASGSGAVALDDSCKPLAIVLGGGGGGDMAMGDGGACAAVTACTAGDGCCPSGCSSSSDSDCPVAVCGDGVVQPPERCDDGNTANGDACDPTCSFGNSVSLVSGFPGGAGGNYVSAPGRVRFYSPRGITTDGLTLYVSDVNGVIAQTDPTSGATSVLVGVPGVHTTVDDPSGTNARFAGPLDLAWLDNTAQARKELFVLEQVPNLLAANPTGWQVRKIIVSDPSHPVTTFLDTASLTGSLTHAVAIAAGSNTLGTAELFVLTDGGVSQWRSLAGGSGSAGPVADVMALNAQAYPNSMGSMEGNCYDIAYAGGNIMYVACPRVILKVDFTGTPVVSVYAGIPQSSATCADNATATAATLVYPNALSVDSTGALWFSDCNTMRKVDATGVNTVAGDGTYGVIDGPTNPKTAELGTVFASAAIGTTLFTVDNVRVRKITSAAVTTVAGLRGTSGVVYDPTGANANYTVSGNLVADAGHLYSTLYYMRQLFGVTLANGGSSLVATLPTLTMPPGSNFPGVMARLGNKLYIAYENGEVRQIDVDGTNEQPFAGTPGVTPKTTALASDGTSLYYLNAANQVGRLESNGAFTALAGASGGTTVQDGTGTGAKFQQPAGLVVAGGDLYTLDGPISTTPGQPTQKTVVRHIALGPMAAANSGVVTTIVGEVGTVGAIDGVGTAARLAGAADLASDGKSLFILDPGVGVFAGDTNGPTIRQVELASGRVTTMIGTRAAWSASTGVGVAATVNMPSAIVFEPTSGDLFYFDESSFFRIH